jgi:hypothetical protein
MSFSVKETETVVHNVQLEEIVVLLQHSNYGRNESPATTGGEQIWFSK